MTGAADLLIVYGDLVFEPRIVRALLAEDAPLSTTIDRSWYRFWSLRMADPLADAETLRLSTDGYILGSGGRPASLREIEGQYMGLSKVRADHVERFKRAWADLDSSGSYGGHHKQDMFMTDFFSALIAGGWKLRAVPVDGGWLEVDRGSDLELYDRLHRADALAPFFDPAWDRSWPTAAAHACRGDGEMSAGPGVGAMHGSTVVILDVEPLEPAAAAAAAPAARPRRALDWVLHAFGSALDAELYFIAGGPREAVARRYPELSVLVDPRWEGTGSVGSLLVAPLRADRECYVTRADLVVRSRLIDRLGAAGGDVAVAVGAGAGDTGTTLVGIARLSPEAVGCLLALRDLDDDRLAKLSMAELLRALAARGLEIRAVDGEGDWVRLGGPQDLARFVLGTKAESLERLRPLVTRCTIGLQVRCTVAEWRAAPQEILAQVAARFGARPLAVRSSARGEDDWGASRAGHFKSVIDVAPDRAAVSRAIDEVIASYGQDPDDQQVLIQEMIDSVQLSGVVFTRTLTHGMPYYTINYDDTTCHTGDVTGGTGKNLRTVVIHRGVAADGVPAQDPRLIPVMRAVLELEELVGHDALDIEFALGGAGEVHVLQLRPITVARSESLAAQLADEALDRELPGGGRGARASPDAGPGARRAAVPISGSCPTGTRPRSSAPVRVGSPSACTGA